MLVQLPRDPDRPGHRRRLLAVSLGNQSFFASGHPMEDTTFAPRVKRRNKKIGGATMWSIRVQSEQRAAVVGVGFLCILAIAGMWFCVSQWSSSRAAIAAPPAAPAADRPRTTLEGLAEKVTDMELTAAFETQLALPSRPEQVGRYRIYQHDENPLYQYLLDSVTGSCWMLSSDGDRLRWELMPRDGSARPIPGNK
jgi:hypothetical protein